MCLIISIVFLSICFFTIELAEVEADAEVLVVPDLVIADAKVVAWCLAISRQLFSTSSLDIPGSPRVNHFLDVLVSAPLLGEQSLAARSPRPCAARRRR